MVVYATITGKTQRIMKERNGRTYVYERTPYYDPIIKNTKYRYRYIGKYVDGKVTTVRSVLPRASIVYGPFIPMLDIVKECGIKRLLDKYLTEDESNAILSLAIAKVVRPLPLRSIGSWYEGTYLSKAFPADMSSQRVSELLDKIGASFLYRDFSTDLIDEWKPSGSLFYDLTTIPSYSIAPIFEYGHAKDHPGLEEINFSLVLEKKRRIPISFEIYPGSVPDVVTLQRMIEFLSELMDNVLIILDRAFFTLHNISLLQKTKFIVAASLQRREVKTAFSKAYRSVDRADNVLLYQDRTIFCQPVHMKIEDVDMDGFFYHDPERESHERTDFHRNLAQRRESIEKLEVRRGVRRTIEGTAGDYLRYITYRIGNGGITTGARNKAISAHENRMGRFILVSNAGLSALECLSIYRERDSIEKAFRSLKTDLDVFPLREHKESTVKGMLFVFFLSMIIRSILLRAMGSSKLSRKYSIESMLIELEKLHMIEDQAGSLREIERTRKQKDILDALSSISWW